MDNSEAQPQTFALPTGAPPLLVASDVDGTLITSKERITARLRQVLVRMTRAGTVLSLSTGRPPRWLFPVLEQLHVRPVCVCANGAIVYDSATDAMVSVAALQPAALQRIAHAAARALHAHGGVGLAVERAGSSAFDPVDQLFVAAPGYAHTWAGGPYGQEPVAELLAQPAIKLLLRNHTLSAREMYALVAPQVPAQLGHITYSVDDGLLEVAAPGVTKAAGVAQLAELIGASAADVVCFGDMPNDSEMLRWAGLGVAMGNGHPEVKNAADAVTTSNDDYGVARVLETWF